MRVGPRSCKVPHALHAHQMLGGRLLHRQHAGTFSSRRRRSGSTGFDATVRHPCSFIGEAASDFPRSVLYVL